MLNKEVLEDPEVVLRVSLNADSVDDGPMNHVSQRVLRSGTITCLVRGVFTSKVTSSRLSPSFGRRIVCLMEG